MKKLLLMVGLITACSSTSLILNGNQYSSYEGTTDKTTNLPEHGFLLGNGDSELCSENTIIQGGYWVKPREPRKGEAQSEYEEYLAAENIRVKVCSKVAIWCASEISLLCRLDDEDCLRKNSGGRANICKVKVLDAQDKKHLHSITTNIGGRSWVVCGQPSDDYIGPVAKAVLTTQALSKDRSDWEQLCLKFRSKDECDRMLKEHETASYFVKPDSLRWLVDIFHDEEVNEISDNDGRLVGTTEVNIKPACGKIEKRF